MLSDQLSDLAQRVGKIEGAGHELMRAFLARAAGPVARCRALPVARASFTDAARFLQ
jgi:hypothetical protein